MRTSEEKRAHQWTFARGVDSRGGSRSSGSIITANYAREQGKGIFTGPGCITTMNAVGTNSLIDKGAKLVWNVDDILEELTPLLKGLLRSSGNLKGRDGIAEIITNLGGLEINNEEKAICNVMGS